MSLYTILITHPQHTSKEKNNYKGTLLLTASLAEAIDVDSLNRFHSNFRVFKLKKNYLQLCLKHRTGTVPDDLLPMKASTYSHPNGVAAILSS